MTTLSTMAFSIDEMISSAELEERAVEDALERYEEKEQAVGSQTMRELERLVRDRLGVDL